jgi:multidrug resistance efflux pump
MEEEKARTGPPPDEAPDESAEESSAAAREPGEAKQAPPKRDPVRWITRGVFLLVLVVFVWYLFADRLTPYTDQGRIQALLTPIVPQVSGYLTEVNVRLHSVVDEGAVLFQVDPRPYEIAVRSAEANLDMAAQQVGAQTATVKSATAQLGVARAQLDRAQRNYNRTQNILSRNPGALSQADKDRAETSLDQALERVTSAEAELQRAKEQLGVAGPDNPQLRAALTALERAQLDLAFTTLHAPDRGAIESFNVDVGYYASPGQPLATFVSSQGLWIQADMRENNIANIEIGDRAEFCLDVAPGRVFEGTVRSVGYGVSTEGGVNRGDLPTVSTTTGWLREPQRFPVIISLEGAGAEGLLRAGGQADVVVYTGSYPLLNTIARWRIRLRTWVSYVR